MSRMPQTLPQQVVPPDASIRPCKHKSNECKPNSRQELQAPAISSLSPQASASLASLASPASPATSNYLLPRHQTSPSQDPWTSLRVNRDGRWEWRVVSGRWEWTWGCLWLHSLNPCIHYHSNIASETSVTTLLTCRPVNIVKFDPICPSP
ncbi:hypothetical protein C8F01DRAFT_1122846 [Mycena amicta]|nr:hypothetical protein C8F01DRAFT_1122846 [Mycena amicta]